MTTASNTAAATSSTTAFTPRAARFTDTFASEWSKITSVRSTWITLGLGFVLALAMTGLIALVIGSTYDDWTTADQAGFEPIMISVVGIILGGIAFAVFGVMAVAGEYSSGMIRTTFTATPRRGRVLMAKVLVVAILTLAFGTATVFGMFLLGQAVLGAFDMPTVTLGNNDALRIVIALSLASPFFPLLGLALGFILRSSAAAITTILAILWVPDIFGGLLPMWWRENILSLLPGTALDALTISHLNSSPAYHDTPIAALVVAAWLLIAIGGTFIVINRRDA